MSDSADDSTSAADPRLQRREPISLPADALVAFERINRGKNPSPNYRWLLLADGELRLARHSGDTSDPGQPFDTPLPDVPSAVLDPVQLATVRQLLADADLDAHPDRVADPGVEDGAFSIVTVPTGRGRRELIFDGAGGPLVDGLCRVADEWMVDRTEATGDGDEDF